MLPKAVALHKGEGLSQMQTRPMGTRVETLGEEFDAGPDAFLDTAAVVKTCDLVITSDTSVAHLAGALGAPTWVALKSVPDWRWLLDRSDSPWYPTVRLFRQSVRGDWRGAFAEIEKELKSLLNV
jgi:ADP-heptose:LPS heptosyltransferase